MPYKNKEDRIAWAQRNKEKGVTATRKWQKRNKENYSRYKSGVAKEHRKWFKQYKKTLSCLHCGITDFRVLQFHHRNPSEKSFTIGARVSQNSVDTILAEIAKCDVLCANCHTIETWKQRNFQED